MTLKRILPIKTLIANRVATLQELTAVHQWRRVPSGSNPVDLISKDLDPRKLLERDLLCR